MAEDFSGKTVNERLFEAGLLEQYDEAVASGDSDQISKVLAQIGLYQDSEGMNHVSTRSVG